MCEIPIKDGSQHDDRIWITASLSLIEFIYVDDFDDFSFRNKIVSSTIQNWFGVLYRIIGKPQNKTQIKF
jgi:hypothetical protein